MIPTRLGPYWRFLEYSFSRIEQQSVPPFRKRTDKKAAAENMGELEKQIFFYKPYRRADFVPQELADLDANFSTMLAPFQKAELMTQP